MDNILEIRVKNQIKWRLYVMKKVILVGLMFVVFGWKDIVSADSVTEENAVISEVKELEQSGKYDFEVVPAEDIDPQNIIQLDSVEELEKF